MAEGSPNKHRILAFLPEIGIGLLVLIILWVVYALLKKFHILGSTESDKLKDAQAVLDTKGAIALNNSAVLQPIKFSEFSKTGVGVAEMHNQFPYTTDAITDMVTKIYSDKPFVGYSDGTASIGVVNSLPSKFALTNLSIFFVTAYGQDLQTFWKTNLHDNAEAAIQNSLSLKPDFVKLLPASQALLDKNNQKLTL